jgi:hypothetical protein
MRPGLFITISTFSYYFGARFQLGTRFQLFDWYP